MTAAVLLARAEFDAQVAERVERGECGCGCGKPLPVRRSSRTKFVSKTHGQRAYRRRLEVSCTAAGLPCRLSLRIVHAPDATRDGNGVPESAGNRAQTGRLKPSGMQVPYVKALDVLAEQLAGVRVPKTRAAARLLIEPALRAALPARQRERLTAGETTRKAA
jgi:hypothetical protein